MNARDESVHLLCEKCWRDHEGDRPPHRVSMLDMRPCCVCELQTRSGIFLREFALNMPCKGTKGIHVGKSAGHAA